MVEGMILPIISSLLPITVSWKVPKIDAESTTLVLAIYTDRLLLVVLVVVVILIAVVVSLSRTAVGVM